jgi:hypothetical protein
MFRTTSVMVAITAFAMGIVCSAEDAVEMKTRTQSLLDKTSHEVSEFLDQMSDVKCTETVLQEKLNPGGHKEYAEHATYDYLILLQGSGDELLLNESRLLQRHDAKPKKNLPLLITNGFSTLFLIFHPYYRDSFRFEEDGSEVVDGNTLTRIRFTHLGGARTPAALSVRGREYPLELTGTAWIVPENGRIAKIDASLANDMHDVGLRTLDVEVVYAAIALPGWEEKYRFPVSARVDVETLKQHWRNVHEFSGYKRFTVASEAVVAEKTEQ